MADSLIENSASSANNISISTSSSSSSGGNPGTSSNSGGGGSSGVSSGGTSGGASSSTLSTPNSSAGHTLLPIVTVEVQVDTTSNTRPPPTMSDGAILITIDNSDEDEPTAKRKKLDSSTSSNTNTNTTTATTKSVTNDKLESRLGGILCCAVCLDLPKTAMYQCQMGHLMCAACFTHILADAKLRNQISTCPNCRVEISKSLASRNLAVEKVVSELPCECQFCNKEYPYKSLVKHEESECDLRPTNCKYFRIGCEWKGPMHEVIAHEGNCLHPKKTGAEVMTAVKANDLNFMKERSLFSTLVELLSYERIIFNDLQMKPYRTDEYIHKLFYETARFSAFSHQWVVTGRINNAQRDPHTATERSMTYQLVLKSKTSSPLQVHFVALKGPFSDVKLNTHIYKHEFTEEQSESPFYCLPIQDSQECNRLLAAKAINFRLIMFLLSK